MYPCIDRPFVHESATQIRRSSGIKSPSLLEPADWLAPCLSLYVSAPNAMLSNVMIVQARMPETDSQPCDHSTSIYNNLLIQPCLRIPPLEPLIRRNSCLIHVELEEAHSPMIPVVPTIATKA
jgi:hypothetical protein